MAAESEAAFVVPIVLFTLALISGTIFIVAWLTRSSKGNAKNSTKTQVKERHPAPGKIKPTASKGKKKPASVPKGNTTAQHKFDHSHLLATLKGHTGQITGGDFSSNGKHFITSAEVVRGCPYLPRSVSTKGRYKSLEHQDGDSGCWLTNSPSSSSNTPSDTEDSLTSSSSSGKMSRRQRRNKKRKKNRHVNASAEPSRNSDDEPALFVPKEQKCFIFLRFLRLGKTEEELHKMLHPLCMHAQERVLNGYPYQTYRGVYVYKAQGFSRIESVLGNHRLVDAEIEDFNSKSIFDCIDEDNSNNFMNSNPPPPFILRDMYDNYMTGGGTNFPQNFQKCTRCRQYFNVWSNGENKTTCFYHPKKAVLTVAGSLQYTCCNMVKPDSGCSGCLVSNFHVFHHLSSGINGPLAGFFSTQATQSPPSIYGLDCEMVFTSLGFEVARATLVNVQGDTVLDIFIQPEGEIFDFNTEFSGVMPEHLLSAVSFIEAQATILSLLKSSDILVGHSLEGDLIVLKILHRRVIDTSLLFKVISNEEGSRGGSPLPRRQGLKTLVKVHLGQDIQKGGSVGHSSVEDATAALYLVLNQVCGESSRKETKKSKIAPLPPLLRAITA